MCRRQLQENLRNQEQTKTFNMRDMRRSDDSGSPVQYRARNGSPLRKSSPKRNIWLSGPKTVYAGLHPRRDSVRLISLVVKNVEMQFLTLKKLNKSNN